MKEKTSRAFGVVCRVVEFVLDVREPRVFHAELERRLVCDAAVEPHCHREVHDVAVQRFLRKAASLKHAAKGKQVVVQGVARKATALREELEDLFRSFVLGNAVLPEKRVRQVRKLRDVSREFRLLAHIERKRLCLDGSVHRTSRRTSDCIHAWNSDCEGKHPLYRRKPGSDSFHPFVHQEDFPVHEEPQHLKILGGKAVEKGEFIFLLLFVGIPIPGTGAWMGSLIAALLEFKLSRAVIAILLGVLMAAVIMNLVSFGLLPAALG